MSRQQGATQLTRARCDVVLFQSFLLGPWVSLLVFISLFMQQECYFLGYLVHAFSPCAHSHWHCLLLTLLRSSRSDCSRNKVEKMLDVELRWFLPVSLCPGALAPARCAGKSYGIAEVGCAGIVQFSMSLWFMMCSMSIKGKVTAEKHRGRSWESLFTPRCLLSHLPYTD